MDSRKADFWVVQSEKRSDEQSVAGSEGCLGALAGEHSGIMKVLEMACSSVARLAGHVDAKMEKLSVDQ